jgi:RimJ/RimL family protein N-acetyltransferase
MCTGTPASSNVVAWMCRRSCSRILHRISTAIGPDNAPSIALVQGLGFQYEGRIRDHVYTNGAWRDSLLYSLLAPERNHDAAVSDDIENLVRPTATSAGR